LAIIAGACASGPRSDRATDDSTDALRRFVNGASVEEVATALSIEKDEAKRRIRRGLMALRCQLTDC